MKTAILMALACILLLAVGLSAATPDVPKSHAKSIYCDSCLDAIQRCASLGWEWLVEACVGFETTWGSCVGLETCIPTPLPYPCCIVENRRNMPGMAVLAAASRPPYSGRGRRAL